MMSEFWLVNSELYLKSISRKIRVAEKFQNFHTVNRRPNIKDMKLAS